MAGNVWEWCQDRSGEEEFRVMRGGSCRESKDKAMIVYGEYPLLEEARYDIGFRCIAGSK